MVAAVPSSSASLATRSFVQSGVKVMLSGTEPTTADPSRAPVVAFRKTTWLLPVFGELMIAEAEMPGVPFRTATEETSLLVRPATPRAAGAMVWTKAGTAGLVRSMTWMPVLEEVKARFETGSKAGISAPPVRGAASRSMLPLTTEVKALVGEGLTAMECIASDKTQRVAKGVLSFMRIESC